MKRFYCTIVKSSIIILLSFSIIINYAFISNIHENSINCSNSIKPDTICNPVTNLSAIVNGGKVTLSWDLPDGNRDIILEEGFETASIPENWRLIDADGDGYNWRVDTIGFLGHNSSYCVSSRSYAYGFVLHPDNYLIIPDVLGAANINYWVCAQDNEYPSEHYAVMVSYTGIEPSDFTIIYEETITAKSNGKKGVRGSNVQGTWYQKSINIPVSAKHIAFRHFNSTDQYAINIDDITINGGNPMIEKIRYNVYQDDIQIASSILETTFTHTGVSIGSYNYCVEAVCSDTCVSILECIDVVVDGNDCYPVTNLSGVASSHDVSLSWDAPTGNRNIILQEGFEAHTLPENWLLIDADGDGYNWDAETNVPRFEGHNGGNCISSASLIEWVGPLTPDNYLITPEISGATHLSYWVSVQDVWYSKEHYAVMVSSTGTSESDFSIIFEESMDNNIKSNSNEDIGKEGQGQWYKRNIILPEDTKYIAFRHYNSTNQYWLNLDDVEIIDGIPPLDVLYNVYQDDILIAENIVDTFYVHSGMEIGLHNYCVEVLYGDTCISPVVCFEVDFQGIVCDPVRDLHTDIEDNNVTLIWSTPLSERNEFILEEGFDDVNTGEIPSGWITIDADGDTHNWYCLVDVGPMPGFDDTPGFVKSDSWADMAKPALTPDNYLITPAVIGASKINYVVRSEASQFFAEHYAIMASSTGTTPDDFTIIFEETLTQDKNIVQDSREQQVLSAWRERSVELPAGTKYIAIRHFDCTDQWAIHIDNIQVEGGNILPPGIVGYNIYQNNQLISYNHEDTTYIVENLEVGEYVYCVETMYGDSCISKQECIDVVILGVEDNNKLNIYPNPADDIVFVSGVDIDIIYVYNSSGRLVNESYSSTIDISNYLPGLYLFKIISTNGLTYTEKIIVRK